VILLVAGTLFLLLFAFGLWRDPRRLRNGVHLMLALLFLAGGVSLEFPRIAPLTRALSLLAALGLLVLIPLCMAALALFLVANGITMIRREGRRSQNLLSLLAGLGMFGFVAAALAVLQVRSLALWTALLSATLVIGYVSFLFSCHVLYSLVYGRVARRGAVDFVVVLGCGLVGDRVSPLLASRLDEGMRAYRAAKEAGTAPKIITSGGQGPDEPVSEARAMATYLVERGVPAEDVLQENESRTTGQNLRFSGAIMARRQPDYRCLVVTNSYHALRAALLARRIGVSGHVLGAPTARYYWPSATIREFAAVFAQHPVVNFGACAALALFAPLLALAATT